MYGMINIALEQLIVEERGQEYWEMVKRKAGFEDLIFTYMESYDDDVTDKLVSVASAELDIEADKLLEDFGAYWVLKTVQKSYANFFKMGGTNVREFMHNLDHIHKRFSVSFRDIKAPQFKVTDEDAKGMTIAYISERNNYLPLTLGLIKGLYEHFNQKGSVSVIGSKEIDAEKAYIIELRFD